MTTPDSRLLYLSIMRLGAAKDTDYPHRATLAGQLATSNSAIQIVRPLESIAKTPSDIKE